LNRFLYFIPKATSPTREELLALGLAHVDDYEMRGCTHGPADANGVIIARKAAGEFGYYPDKQTWRKRPGDDVHVGFYTDRKPGPEDLLRPDALPGHPVTLADGNAWLVPVVRSFADSSGEIVPLLKLPAKAELGDDGKWTGGQVVDRHQPLLSAAQWWLQVVFSGADQQAAETALRVTFDFDQACQHAVSLLAANYRMGAVEAALLGIFDQELVANILNAAVDLPGFVELGKKKASAGSSTNDGGGD
jgi:hypothetical protein